MVDYVAIVKSVSTPFVILENNKIARFHLKLKVDCEIKTIDFLASHCPLSKQKIKSVLQKGGVWLKRKKHKQKRLRKSTYRLYKGDELSIYYDEAILSLSAPIPQLLAEEKHYSIWLKPAGLLTQGSKYGDHCSLLRFTSKYFQHAKNTKLVHRLDREAFGIVIVAHDRRGAAGLSKLFQSRKVEKHYRVEVWGKAGEVGKTFTLDYSLDGKVAKTFVTVLSYCQQEERTRLDVLLETGRFHQIRRHLHRFGHSIVGDTKYGDQKLNKGEALRLCAYRLAFRCPFASEKKEYTIEPF